VATDAPLLLEMPLAVVTNRVPALTNVGPV
jgi:hypothetical protein